MNRTSNSQSKSLLLALFLCLPFLGIFARENFIPGYIINLDGDTVHGQIDYRNWEANPKTIRFRLSEND